MKIKTEFNIGDTVFYNYGTGDIKGNIYEIRVIRIKTDGTHEIAYAIEPEDKISETDEEDVVEEGLVARTKDKLKEKLKQSKIKIIERKLKFFNTELNQLRG